MTELHTAARDPQLQALVKLAFTSTSIAAVNEVDTHPNHTERMVMAGKILHGISDPYDLTMGVLNNATIQATVLADGMPPIGDIQYSVNEIYDAFALTA